MELNLIKRRELQRPLAPSEMDSNFEMIENVINNNVGGGAKYNFPPYLIGPFNLYSNMAEIIYDFDYVIDFSKINNVSMLCSFSTDWRLKLSDIIGSEFLTGIRDFGTYPALNFANSNISSVVIDKLFTELPITNKVATIDVSYNPGSSACDPSIATAKGYIVIT